MWTGGRSYWAGAAAFARRQLVAAAAARLGRRRLWRPGVLLAGPDADHLDLALGRLRPERRCHCHMGSFNAFGGDAGPRWWLGLSGVVSVLAGAFAFWYTGMTTLVLLMFIAAWAVIIGATQIWGAIALRSVLQHEWLLLPNGALSIAFGV